MKRNKLKIVKVILQIDIERRKRLKNEWLDVILRII